MGARRGGRLAALALALPLAGCALFPAPGASARRLGHDLFVVASSPLQVPLVAARDAWEWSGAPERSRAWLPVAFVGGVLVHGGLAVLHLADVAATPIHFVAGNGPAPTYDGFALPHRDAPEPLAPAAGELALYGVAGVGGAAIAWWFGGTYVPHLFRFFTGG